jgi:hypothetical protein
MKRSQFRERENPRFDQIPRGDTSSNNDQISDLLKNLNQFQDQQLHKEMRQIIQLHIHEALEQVRIAQDAKNRGDSHLRDYINQHENFVFRGVTLHQ